MALERLDIEWGGETLSLDPRRAVIRAGGRDVIIADPHLGKDGPARNAIDVVHDDLARLASIVDEVGAQRVIVLGDLLHAEGDREAMKPLGAWVAERPDLETLFIAGSREELSPPATWGVRVQRGGLVDGGLELVGAPPKITRGAVVTGGMHPGASVGEDPVHCFWARDDALALPAFGSSAAIRAVRLDAGGQLYACVGSRVRPASAR